MRLNFQFNEADSPIHDPWPVVYLLGHEERTDFTFQLGPPGGDKGYEAIASKEKV